MDLLLGVVDPGVARWLGFLDVDEDVADEGVVVAYVVDALFAPNWAAAPRGGPRRHDRHRIRSSTRVARRCASWPSGPPNWNSSPTRSRTSTVARSSSSASCSPPRSTFRWTRRGCRPWTRRCPATGCRRLPPTAARELTLGLEGLVPGAGLASAIAQPQGNTPVERNPKDTVGRRLLLTPRPDAAATTATSGVLADREVDERDGNWQVAQLDWFGRWSSWASRTFGSGHAAASAAPGLHADDPAAGRSRPGSDRPARRRRADRGVGSAGVGAPGRGPVAEAPRAHGDDERRGLGRRRPTRWRPPALRRR